MKTTVKYLNVDFKEVVENGINKVICTLTSEIQSNRVKYFNLIDAAFDVKTLKRKYKRAENGNVIIETTGVAKCNPDDKYNFEVGRRLAYTRAQSRAFERAVIFYDEVHRRFLADLNNTISNCLTSSVGCDYHTYELIYGEDAEDKFIEDNYDVDDKYFCEDDK